MSKIKLALPEELIIYNVSTYREEILDNLSDEEELVLDCKQVEEVDAAGIQLLLSLQRMALKKDFRLYLENVNPKFRSTLQLAGVEKVIGRE
ncbi:hypothetical protein JCM16358_04330 [Halanaerocella petrolearia]